MLGLVLGLVYAPPPPSPHCGRPLHIVQRGHNQAACFFGV